MMECQVVTARPYAVDQESADRLWKLTEALVGGNFFIKAKLHIMYC